LELGVSGIGGSYLLRMYLVARGRAN